MKIRLSVLAFSLAAMLFAGNPEKIFHIDFENIKAEKDVTDSVGIRCYGDLKTVPGVEGNAFLFDGKKSAIRSVKKTNLSFSSETSFTIEYYIKPEHNPAKNWSYPAMVGGIRFAGRPHKNSPFLFVSNGKKRLATIGVGTAPYNDGKWHHVAMVRDAVAREISFYCDGKKIKTVKETQQITDLLATPVEMISVGSAGYLNHYKGAMDEFVIWKGAKRNFDLSKIKQLNKVKQPPVEISKDVAASWKVLKDNKINLVPAPKSIKVDGTTFQFEPAKWCVERKETSDAPGFEHFVKRLNSCNVNGAFAQSGKKRIVAGLFKDVSQELTFKADCQPRQGYVIDVTPEKIVIAGTDEDGLRYGWLTLSALLDDSGKMRCAKITDYPDFLERGGHYSPYTGTEEAQKKNIDEIFLLRLNRLYTTRILPLQDLPEYVKRVNEYARARGIKCAYVGVPSVEDIPDFKKMIPRGQDAHTYSYRSDEGIFGWYGHAISWSRDDLAEAQAKKAADFMKKHGFHCFMLHPVDAGGVDNPCRWNSRSKKCREKWGDDFFAAHEHLIKIYSDTLKKYNPELQVYYVAYPYMPKMLVSREWAGHVKRLKDLCGVEVRQVVREGVAADMKTLSKITPAMFTVFYPFMFDYLNMYCNSARYMTTFYVLGLNSLASFEIWSPAGSRLNATRFTFSEYMWNHNAPGAENKPEGLYTNYELITAPSAEVDQELLPRICAYLYGEKAAEVMAKVFAAKLSERHSEHPFKVLPVSIDQEKYFAGQVALTDDLLAQMKNIKGLVKTEAADAWSLKYNFVRKVNIGSRARLCCIRANKFAGEGKTKEAIAEAEKGLTLLQKPQGYIAAKQLRKELDISEKLKSGAVKRAYAAKGKHRKINVAFYQYTGTGNGGSSSSLPLMNSFNKMGGINTLSVSDPTVNVLKGVDVMIFSATKYVGDTSEDWRANIRNMVEKDGKGVIFSHNAVGREKLTNLGKAIFPEICSGFDSRVADRIELTVEDDTIFKGFLKKGEKYREAYIDHLTVVPGKDARVLLRDDTGKVVAVAGKVGKGFVVYTGEIFGVSGKKELLGEPAFENWKMLYHLIRYASGE